MFVLTVWLNQKVNAMKETDRSTEERIIRAAREVFIGRGFDGARMQEIADKAGINKALLHYYFRSKQQLFEVVFTETLGKFQQTFIRILSSDKPLIEKIRAMVSEDIDILMKNPNIPLFVISEVAKNPEGMTERARDAGLPKLIEEFSKQVRSAVRRKEIRRVDPVDLLINILSLNRFPFIGQPMLCSMIESREEKFQAMMKKRTASVAELIINDLQRNTSGS